jgi:hypothetical protein
MFFNRAVDEHMIWLLKPSIESREDGVRRRSGNVRLADHLNLKTEMAEGESAAVIGPQGFPLLGWHHLIDATAANREALWNQARRHLHPFPFPFLG